MPKNNKKVKVQNGNKNNNNNNQNGKANPEAQLVRTKKSDGTKVLRLNGPPETVKYAKGLLDPFSDNGCGARVPDQFYAPTCTLAYREFVSLANNATGTMDAVFLPSALCPVFSTRGSITNGQPLFTRDGSTISNGCVRNTGAQLYPKITSHRIVNWGLRIRNTSPVTAAQGIITIALFNPYDSSIVPHAFAVGSQIGTNSSSTSATIGEYLKTLGLGGDQGNANLLDISGLVDLPCHMRCSATNLSENTYQILPKLISPRALEFRASQDNQYGTDIVAQTSLTYVQPGASSYIRCDGWTGIAIGYTGGSTVSGTNTFDVEVVYNLEGAPNVQVGTTFIGSSSKVVCDPIGMLNAQSTLDMAQAFQKVTIGAMAAYRTFAGV